MPTALAGVSTISLEGLRPKPELFRVWGLVLMV